MKFIIIIKYIIKNIVNNLVNVMYAVFAIKNAAIYSVIYILKNYVNDKIQYIEVY